jgi:aminopeptidase N
MRKVKRLYSEFKPEHYELWLEPDREKMAFAGNVVISGHKISRPSRRITFHQKGLKIKSAKIINLSKPGSPEIQLDRINIHNSFGEVRLHTKGVLYPGRYRIKMEFAGKITAPMHGIYPCNFMVEGKRKQLVATQFESHHAREAFPCIDEPAAKASFGLTLVTPKGETVIANTPVKTQNTEGRRLTTTFEKTPVMSTYLLAFAYGELSYKESQTKNGTSVRIYSTTDKVRLTDFALDTAVRCLEFFEGYFSVPYPLPKLDLIGLPDFSAGAMENWGLVTFRESVLYVDPENSSIDTKQVVAMVVCHELAHQWFGNLVTMEWWNDLWLNESFANLMEYRAVDELYPDWDIWRDFVQRELSSALNRDALPTVQALQTDVDHPDQLAALFDPSIVYAKGGSLLNMLRLYIGEDSFRKGLAAYFNEFKYANTKADDLWRHFKRASGTDVGRLMNNWLRKPGFPVIDVKLAADRSFIEVKQKRLEVSGHPSESTALWQVPLGLSWQGDDELLVNKGTKIKVKSRPDDYPLTLNHDGRSYFVSRYTQSSHLDEILAAVSGGVLSPIDRLLLVQNYLLMERAGLTSTLDNVKLLPFYAQEREETVWGMLAGVIGNVRTLIGTERELETKLNAFIRPAVAPLLKQVGWQAKPNEPDKDQKLRALALSLAAVAEDQAVIKKGLDLFKDFERPSDLASDIRSAVYFMAVRFGPDGHFDKLVNLYENLSNADEKDEIAAELTTTRDADKHKRLLKMMTDSKVRAQDAPTWFALLIRNRYATDAVWRWLQDNWQWVEANYASDKSLERFPRYAAMVFSYPQQLKQFKSFFEPRANIALERPIALGIEEIEGRLAWRKRNEASVIEWLKELDVSL